MKRLLSRDQKHIYTEMVCEVNQARHNTILKRWLNPVLRRLGWSIVSVFNEDRFLGYRLRRYPQYCAIDRTNQ